MPRQRKIKHYSYASLNRRRKRGKIIKIFLFLLLLAALIFLGYCVAESIGKLSENRESSQQEESSWIAESSTLSNPESSEESSEENLSSSESEVQAEQIRAILVPNIQTLETFLPTVDPEVYNTVVLDLKNSTGNLAYRSEVPLATSCGAVSTDAISLEELAAAADSIRAAGFVPAARIYTLQDDLASHATYGTSYLYENQTGITWLDQAADKGGRSWLNPYMTATQEYLDAIVEEIAQAGFERIFAAGMQYPDTRYPQQMGYGPNQSSMTLTEALQVTLNGMESATAAHDSTIIPIYMAEGYLGENDALYGGSPDQIQSEEAAPILPEGQENAVLQAIQTSKDLLIPVITSSQISLLEQNQISQYFVLS
ncbi:MAG: putative glycoside hydrolase [Candidatus Merdivicinus sp.]|jgi:hypothetical protein